jgi:hypothetical protein
MYTRMYKLSRAQIYFKNAILLGTRTARLRATNTPAMVRHLPHRRVTTQSVAHQRLGVNGTLAQHVLTQSVTQTEKPAYHPETDIQKPAWFKRLPFRLAAIFTGEMRVRTSIAFVVLAALTVGGAWQTPGDVGYVPKADLDPEREATFLATSGALGPIFSRWI